MLIKKKRIYSIHSRIFPFAIIICVFFVFGCWTRAYTETDEQHARNGQDKAKVKITTVGERGGDERGRGRGYTCYAWL